MKYDIEAFNHLIRHRRSIFPDQYEPGKQVPTDVITQILENAIWAPNHGLTEPWYFTVFSGDGLKKFATFQSELYKSEAGAAFKEAKYFKLQQQPLRASHVIAIGMKRSAERKIPEIEEIEAVSCAVQNMYLTTTAYGLGGYWTTGGITYITRAKSFFGLGEDDKLLGFFYVGYIAHPPTAGFRRPLEEKVAWVS